MARSEEQSAKMVALEMGRSWKMWKQRRRLLAKTPQTAAWIH
jgi:hypothetical protein